MLLSDFDKYKIKKFTGHEVERTGSRLVDVNVFTMVKLQAFRMHPKVRRAVVLLPGGMTTGEHGSFQHPNGTAVDIAFHELERPLSPKQLVYAAVDVGFRGIGLYYNGTALSMHLDLGPELRRWLWIKPHRSDRWTRIDLILDPIYLKRKGAIKWPRTA